MTASAIASAAFAQSCSRTDNNPEVYEWLLKQKRRGVKKELAGSAGVLIPAIPQTTNLRGKRSIPPEGFGVTCSDLARFGPCAVKRRVDSSGCEPRPVTGRSNR